MLAPKKMVRGNSTLVTEFILLGLTDRPELQPFFFCAVPGDLPDHCRREPRDVGIDQDGFTPPHPHVLLSCQFVLLGFVLFH